jgi:hypothetical protein
MSAAGCVFGRVPSSYGVKMIKYNKKRGYPAMNHYWIQELLGILKA